MKIRYADFLIELCYHITVKINYSDFMDLNKEQPKGEVVEKKSPSPEDFDAMAQRVAEYVAGAGKAGELDYARKVMYRWEDGDMDDEIFEILRNLDWPLADRARLVEEVEERMGKMPSHYLKS